MKVNRPVTNHEIQMKKGQILVSRTDLKGILTYANDEFIAISGYSSEELIGKNHNIVRHPDMPPAAFDDLWLTLKTLRSWRGIVKNRTKSGDYYWAKTNVMPVFKNGKVHEYLSVRRAPSCEQIEQAEQLYKRLNTLKTTVSPIGLAAMNKSIKEAAVWKKMALVLTVLLLPVFYLMHQLFLARDYPLLAGVAGAVTIALTIGFNVIKGFSAMLNKTIDIFYRLAEKKFGSGQNSFLNYLFDDFLRTLYVMEVNLDLDLTETRDDAASAIQLSQALDHVHAGAMVINNNFEIIYMNNSLLEVFTKAANNKGRSCRVSMPVNKRGVDTDSLVKDLEQQRYLSEDLKEPYGSELHIAGLVIRFSVCS